MYVIGYCLDIGIELYYTGRSQYFSNWHRYVFVSMVAAFVMYYLTWLAGYIGLQYCTNPTCTAPFQRVYFYDVVLTSYSFYTIGILLSFVYLLSSIQFNRTLGPLLMTLLHMLQDVKNFFLFFLVLFAAFVVSLKKLYLQYVQSSARFFQGHDNSTRHHHKMSGYVIVKKDKR